MKSDKYPSLNALRVFAAAAYAGSFKQVAQELGVSQSAITRQIQTLEEQLGTRLFQRDNRLHALTPAGQRLAPELQHIFASLNRLLDQTQTFGDSDVATLRVAVPQEWMRWWLADQLSDFNALYPHIRIVFSTLPLYLHSAAAATAVEQLQHEQLDLVLACSRLRDKQIQATNLGHCQFVPVSRIQDPAPELVDWLVNPESEEWQAFSKKYSKLTGEFTPLRSDNVSMAVDLALTSDVVTLVDERFLAHPQLQALKRVADLQVALPQPLSLFTKKRLRQPVALVAFSKWLQARLQTRP